MERRRKHDKKGKKENKKDKKKEKKQQKKDPWDPAEKERDTIDPQSVVVDVEAPPASALSTEEPQRDGAFSSSEVTHEEIAHKESNKEGFLSRAKGLAATYLFGTNVDYDVAPLRTFLTTASTATTNTHAETFQKLHVAFKRFEDVSSPSQRSTEELAQVLLEWVASTNDLLLVLWCYCVFKRHKHYHYVVTTAKQLFEQACMSKLHTLFQESDNDCVKLLSTLYRTNQRCFAEIHHSLCASDALRVLAPVHFEQGYNVDVDQLLAFEVDMIVIYLAVMAVRSASSQEYQLRRNCTDQWCSFWPLLINKYGATREVRLTRLLVERGNYKATLMGVTRLRDGLQLLLSVLISTIKLLDWADEVQVAIRQFLHQSVDLSDEDLRKLSAAIHGRAVSKLAHWGTGDRAPEACRWAAMVATLQCYYKWRTAFLQGFLEYFMERVAPDVGEAALKAMFSQFEANTSNKDLDAAIGSLAVACSHLRNLNAANYCRLPAIASRQKFFRSLLISCIRGSSLDKDRANLLEKFFIISNDDTNKDLKMALEPFITIIDAQGQARQRSRYHSYNKDTLLSPFTLLMSGSCRTYACQFSPDDEQCLQLIRKAFKSFPSIDLKDCVDQLSRLESNYIREHHLGDSTSLPGLYELLAKAVADVAVEKKLTTLKSRFANAPQVINELIRSFMSEVGKPTAAKTCVSLLCWISVCHQIKQLLPDCHYALPPSTAVCLQIEEDQPEANVKFLVLYSEAFFELKAPIQRYIDEHLTLKLITSKQLQAILPSLNLYVKWELLSEEIAEEVRQFKEDWSSLRTRLDECSHLARWLRSKRVKDVEEVQEPNFEKATLADWETAVQDAVEQLEEFGLEEKDVATLALFLTKRSAIFRISEMHIMKKLDGKPLEAGHASEMIAETAKFLEKLTKLDEQNLGAIEPVYLLSKQKRDLSDELNIAAAFFNLSASYTTEDSAQLVNRLSDALNLLDYADHLPFLFDFMQKHQLCLAHIQLLQRTAEPLLQEHKDQVLLSQVPGLLRPIRAALAELDPKQLDYFKAATDVEELVAFLSQQQDFEQSINFLSGDLQGYEFGLGVLNSLLAAHRLFSPLVDLLRTAASRRERGKENLTQFCKEVKERLGSAVDSQLDEVRKLLEHLPQVRVWFARTSGLTLDTALAYIARLFATGYYQSRLALHPSGDDFCLCFTEGGTQSQQGRGIQQKKVEHKIPFSHLQDLIRGIAVFVNQSSIVDEERLRQLNEFVEIFRLADQAHKLRLQLEAKGHPDFQGADDRLNQGDQDLSANAYQRMTQELEEKLELWTRQLERAYNNYPRLLWLDQRQMSRMMASLKSLEHVQGANEKNSKATKAVDLLSPFFWACFPDVLRWEDEDAEKRWREAVRTTITEEVRGVLSTLEDSKASVTAGERLDIAGRALSQLEEEIRVGESDDEEEVNGKPPVVVTAYEMDGWEMFRLFITLTTTPIHPAQVLYCKDNLDLNELHRFLRCVQAFPSAEFFLVGVDALSIRGREALIKWASHQCAVDHHNDDDPFAEPKESEGRGGGLVRLIFLQKIGVEVFSFLEKESYDASRVISEVDLRQNHRLLLPRMVRQRMKLRSLECHMWPPCSGKSHLIRKRREELQHQGEESLDHWMTVSITESFVPSKFIAMYRNLASSSSTSSSVRTIGVHLNMSAYAPLAVVGRFLELFIFWGMLWDESTGDMEKIHAGDQWHIFVELAAAPDHDKHFVHASSLQKVLSQLPAVNHAAETFFSMPQQPQREGSPTLDIDADVRLAHSFFASYYNGKFGRNVKVLTMYDNVLQAYAAAEAGTAVREEDLNAIFDFLRTKYGIDLPALPLHQRSFLKLLADRCRWMKERVQSLQSLVKQQVDVESTPIDCLLELFLAECGRLCERQLRENISVNPPVLTSRSFDGHWADIDVLDLRPLEGGRDTPISVPKTSVLSLADAFAFPEQLRVKIAHGLGLTRTDKMWRIVEQQGYVLTPDFAVKLLILNEKRRIRMNVVLSGDTGVGKTEMLNLYSVIVNSDSQLVPDLLFEMRTFLMEEIARQSAPKVDRDDRLAALKECGSHPRSHQLLAALDALCELAQAEDDARALAEEQEKDEAEGVAVATATSSMELMAGRLEARIRALLANYSLIKRTHLLARVERSQPHPPSSSSPSSSSPSSGAGAGSSDGATVPAVGGGVEGEWRTTVKNVDQVKQLAEELVNARFVNLFHRITMHQKYTQERLHAELQPIFQTANQLEDCTRMMEGGGGATVVVFVDEFNATNIMGVLKEIFVDHSLDGEVLPSNIFWVAAMNPFVPILQEEATTHVDFTGLATSEESDEVFAVRPPPRSMEELLLDFRAMDAPQEHNFVRVLMDVRYDIGSEEVRLALQRFILFGQEFVRRANIHRVHVSIRDIMRVVQLYKYFTYRPFVLRKETLSPENLHWLALIMSITMSYYFRLLTPAEALLKEKEKEGGSSSSAAAFSRQDFEEQMGTLLKQSGCPAEWWNYRQTIMDCMKHLYEKTNIPAGIARTDALLENLWCTVICIDAKIPLIIVGPPGCSKTLSFTIAVDNMKGKQSDRGLYRKLHHLYPFRYQCSRHSTDTEIEAIYQSAISRQRTFEGDQDPEQCSVRSTVLLDEGNLPENSSSMKVIHYHMDHAKVPTVILANKPLDAAKTNRALQLFQSAPSHNDLRALAAGCVCGSHGGRNGRVRRKGGSQEDGLSPLNASILDALCKAFERSNEFAEKTCPNLFHLRDFVYLLRFLRKHCTSQGEDFQLTREALLMGLQRNFNGIDGESHRRLIRMWFHEVNKALQTHGDLAWAFPSDIEWQSCIPLLEQSLGERLEKGENPNTAAFRYTMVLDPTDSGASLSLLLWMGICKADEVEFCHMGDFAEDNNEFARMNAILKVKTAMSEGRTVVLVNAASIYSCFYDVFNRHFTVLRSESQAHSSDTATSPKQKQKESRGRGLYFNEEETEEGQQEAKKTEYQYYANVAIGSYSRPCMVHPNFWVIVHVPMSTLKDTPLPFLNRFEKYILSVSDGLKHAVALRKWKEVAVSTKDGGSKSVSMLDIIEDGLEDFVERVHDGAGGRRLLYGLVPQETTASLLLNAVQHSSQQCTTTLDFPPPFSVPASASSVAPLPLPKGEEADREEATELLAMEEDFKLVKDGDQEKKNENEVDEEYPDFADEEEEIDGRRGMSTTERQSGDVLFSNNGIRATLRRLNFRLLQLARPEILFSCRMLPANYVTEYFANQEHLSVMRFLQFLNRAYRMKEYVQDHTTNKWCVYTRTSGELLRVHHDQVLLQFFIKEAFRLCLPKEAEGEQQQTKKETKREFQLMCLHTLSSSKECENVIKEFVEESAAKALLVCVADMYECSTNQVNMLRTFLDRHLLNDRLAVIILHFPPEMSVSKHACYPAVYLNGWDFLYVDHLGLETTTTAAGLGDCMSLYSSSASLSASIFDVEPQKAPGSQQHHSAQVDGRMWIAKAFGLDVGKAASFASTKAAFSHMFFDLLRKHCFAFRPSRTILLNKLKASKAFYSPQSSKQERFDFMRELFRSHSYLYEAILERFVHTWSGPLLHAVVRESCEAVAMGQLFSSLVQTVCSSLRFLLEAQLIQILQPLWSFHSLETVVLASTVEQESSEEGQMSVTMMRRLIRMMIGCLEPPPLDNLLERRRESVRVRFATGERRANPASFPMYEDLEERIMTLMQQAITGLASQQRTAVDVHHKLAELTDHNFLSVLRFIHSQPSLYLLFKQNFVQRTLKLGNNITSPWMDLYGLVLDSMSAIRGTSKEAVLGLFISRQFDQPCLAFFALCLGPLQHLREPLPDVATVTKDLPAVPTPRALHGFACRLAIDQLWTRLTKDIIIDRSREKEEEQELLLNWCKCFRELRQRMPERQALLQLLIEEEEVKNALARMQFDSMLCIFLFQLNMNLSIEDLLARLRTDSVTQLVSAIVKKDQNEKAKEKEDEKEKERGLHLAVRWMIALCREKEIEKNSHGGKYFVQDVIRSFLSKATAEDDVLKEERMQDLELYLRLCAENEEDSELLREFVATWWQELSLDWRTRLLYLFLRDQKEELQRPMLQLAGEVIATSYSNRSHLLRYNYNSNHLTKKDENDQEKELEAIASTAYPLEDMLFFILLKQQEEDTENDILPTVAHRFEQLCNEIEVASSQEGHNGLKVQLIIQRAALACILLRKAAQSLCDESKASALGIVEEWPEQPANTLGLVRLLLCEMEGPKLGAPLEAARFFFVAFPRDQGLVRLLKCREALQQLGLAERWAVAEDAASIGDGTRFSFMLEQNSETGREYQRFNGLIRQRELQAFNEYLRQQLENEEDVALTTLRRHRLRMFVLLVVYYDFFNQGKACPFLAEQLNIEGSHLVRLLDINPQERQAILLFTNAPAAASSRELDPLQFLFSADARKREEQRQQQENDNGDAAVDLTRANMIVNCLAIALGCPRESNHVYNRIFLPATLHNTFGPGSDYQRRNWDCGYKTQEQIAELTQMSNPPVMNNIRRYRLCINALAWLPLCVTLLLDPQHAFRVFTTNYHFLNNWKDEALQRGGRARSEEEQVKAYVFNRGATFVNMLCTDPEMMQQRMDGPHFFTEALLRIWQLSFATPQHQPPPSFIAVFDNADQVKAYEDVIQSQVFDYVSQRYVELREVHLQAAKAHHHNMAELLDLRAVEAARFFSPLDLSYRVYAERIHQELTTTAAETSRPLLRAYVQHAATKLPALQYVPDLVLFYRMMNSVFVSRLSEKDAKTLFVPQAISQCLREEEKETVRIVVAAFERFKRSWNKAKAIHGQLQGMCRNQQDQRAFEQLIVDVDDESPLIECLLTLPDSDGTDAIIRFLQTIVAPQDEILMKRDGMDDRQGLLFDEGDAEREVDLSLLASGELEREQQQLLFTGWDLREFEECVCMQACFVDERRQRSDLSFDNARIERMVVERTSGKIELGRAITALRQTFVLRVDDCNNEENEDSSLHPSSHQQPNAGIRDGALTDASVLKKLRSYHLLQLCLKLPNGGPFADPLPVDKKKQLEVSLREVGQEELFGLIDFFEEIVRHVLDELQHQQQEDKNTLKLQTMSLLRFHLRFLKDLCQLVVKKEESKDYRFINIPTTFKVPLPSPALEELDRMFKLLLGRSSRGLHNRDTKKKMDKNDDDIKPLTRKEAQRWYDTIQAVTEMLLQAENANKIINSNTAHPLMLVMERDLKAMRLTAGNLMIEEVEQIFPKSIKVEHYVPYLCLLHELYGELTVRMSRDEEKRRRRRTIQNAQQQAQHDVVIETDEVYVEKVPEEVEKLLEEEEANYRAVPNPESIATTPSSSTDKQQESFFHENYMLDLLQLPSPSMEEDIDSFVFITDENTRSYGITPAATTRACGLVNLGNTCWLNAVLQCLSRSDLLTKRILHPADHHQQNNTDAPLPQPHSSYHFSVMKPTTTEDLLNCYRRLVGRLLSGEDKSFRPSELYRLVCALQPEFGGCRMHDSHEFLTFFLQHLLRAAPSLEEAVMITCKQHVKCTSAECQSTIDGTETLEVKHLCLPLLLSRGEDDANSSNVVVTLQDLVSGYFQPEQVKRRCDACAVDKRTEEIEAIKQEEIKQLPEIVIIHLRRYQQYQKGGAKYYRKLNHSVIIPSELEFPRYSSSSPPFPLYSLYAICHHSGNLETGHNYARVYNADHNEWYLFDDEYVTAVGDPFHDVMLRKTAYLLFYKKTDRPIADTPAKQEEVHKEEAQTDKENEEEKQGKGEHESIQTASENENEETEANEPEQTTKEEQEQKAGIQATIEKEQKEEAKDSEKEPQGGVESTTTTSATTTPITLARFLDDNGLSSLLPAFEEQEITLDLLPDLTSEDWKDLGVKIGQKTKLLKAFKALSL
ncbi:Replication factor C small subunit [Balamuthia mandrillaris]